MDKTTKILIYIASFILLGPIGCLIVFLVFKITNIDEKFENKKMYVEIRDFTNSLESLLNTFFIFKDAYLQSDGDMICMHISSNYNHSGDYTDVYMEVKVTVNDWWEQMMWQNKTAFENMQQIFVFDVENKTFTNNQIHLVSARYDQVPSYEEIVKSIHNFLDKYEENNAGIAFERESYGANIKFEIKREEQNEMQ